MTHPEEHILELYVLNAESVASRRAGIEEHLRACDGCKALVAEISAFYGELDRELRKPDESAAADGRALMRRVPDLAVWEERLAKGSLGGWTRPVRKLRSLIRRHPIAAAGTTFAFASLAVLGLLAGYDRLTRNPQPSYVVVNPRNGLFEVFNSKNSLLWSRPIPDYSTLFDEIDRAEMPRHAVLDVDGDGTNEVLTTIHLAGEPKLAMTNLHIFDGEGDSRDVAFTRAVNFRGNAYQYPSRIGGGSLILVDSTDPRGVQIFVTAKTDRSPTAILRIDDRLEITGEYWHQGQVVGMYLDDLDGDGRNELIACGFDDVDDVRDLPYPFISVLDPRNIVGVTESSATRGYGFGPSTAEIYYLRFPVTEYNRLLKTGASIARYRRLNGRLIFLWNCTVGKEGRFELDFEFTNSLEPLRVVSSTQIHQLFEREYAAGRISSRLDDACLERLRLGVRFWDGTGWSERPVRVGGGPSRRLAGADTVPSRAGDSPRQ